MEIRRCQVKNLKEKVKLFIKKVHLLKDVYGSMIDIELKMRWFNDFRTKFGPRASHRQRLENIRVSFIVVKTMHHL